MKKEDFFQHETCMPWNMARVAQLERALGKDWFPGKRVLDVGCGHGNNGRLIAQLGAEVVFTDGRQFFVDFMRDDGFEAYLIDHDFEWTVPGHFDLVVHWGLLYHLNNWRQDLACALKVAPMLCLETEISDHADPSVEFKVNDPDTYDQAVNRIGSVMSANCLQGYVESLDDSITWKRYDVDELNIPLGSNDGTHFYNWTESNSGNFRQGQRRFWIFQKNGFLKT